MTYQQSNLDEQDRNTSRDTVVAPSEVAMAQSYVQANRHRLRVNPHRVREGCDIWMKWSAKQGIDTVLDNEFGIGPRKRVGGSGISHAHNGRDA